jgi:CheY-like chemotaxis protein
VVEDEPAAAQNLRAILEGAGAFVFTATNASEALRLIQKFEPSAAVLDYGQDSNRQALARRLAALGIPFIFWSRHDLSRYSAWPNVPVVSKPARRSEIISTLHRLLPPHRVNGSEIAPSSG